MTFSPLILHKVLYEREKITIITHFIGHRSTNDVNTSKNTPLISPLWVNKDQYNLNKIKKKKRVHNSSCQDFPSMRLETMNPVIVSLSAPDPPSRVHGRNLR